VLELTANPHGLGKSRSKTSHCQLFKTAGRAHITTNRKGAWGVDSEPVELDERRGMAAQKSTEIRRRSHEIQADQAALREREEAFERQAIAGPSTTWTEAAAKARYLIELFAATPEARNPRRQELIARVLDDLARLSQ
jgi:hypothetical protein